MKFAPNFIPYLTFRLAYHPHSAIAFVEPDATTQTDVALASFVDTSSLPLPNTAFIQTSDENVPLSFASNLSVLEDRFGLEAGSTMIDARSGKVASLHLKQPILPGDGVGNNLLWSVGSGYDAPTSSEEWSKLSVEAVKVRSLVMLLKFRDRVSCLVTSYNIPRPGCLITKTFYKLTQPMNSFLLNRTSSTNRLLQRTLFERQFTEKTEI